MRKIDWNIIKNAPLFAFWFILARVIEAVGSILNKITGLNIKLLGEVFTLALIFLLLADIIGIDTEFLFNVKKLNAIKF
jgi:hypothetical protein